jgi:hypothetical protein
MMYLTGCNGPLVRPLLDSQVLGLLNTPKSNYKLQPNWAWAADNGCFNAKTYVGDEAWLAWLKKFDAAQREGCLFATAPDVVGDSVQSLARSLPFLPVIRDLGYPVALVTQDGMQPDEVPWPEIDWLFIGGTDRHKLGGEAKALIAAAKGHGKMVHVGRVNSQKRFLAFAALGTDSVDGTFLAFAPKENLPKLLSWIRHNDHHQTLFSGRFNG